MAVIAAAVSDNWPTDRVTAGPAITTLRAMAGVRTKRLRWSMFWAVVGYFITTLGTQLTNYLTSFDLTPLQAALISTGVGLAVVMIGVLIDHASDREATVTNPPDTYSPGTYSPGTHLPGTYAPGRVQPGRPGTQPRPRPNGRTSLAAALAIMLLVCGGGGLAVAYGAQWAAGKVTALFADLTGESKDDPGVERLAAQVSETKGVLTITVKSVQVNDRATVIDLSATNAGDESITLTRGFCQLGVPGKPTLKPDQFNGSWGDGVVPSHGEHNGTIIFDGRLEPETKQVTLAFTQIFVMGPGGPRDIAVKIALT